MKRIEGVESQDESVRAGAQVVQATSARAAALAIDDFMGRCIAMSKLPLRSHWVKYQGVRTLCWCDIGQHPGAENRVVFGDERDELIARNVPFLRRFHPLGWGVFDRKTLMKLHDEESWFPSREAAQAFLDGLVSA